MFSNPRIDLFRRLSFHLTLWYGVIFTICCVALLLIFYSRVAQVTREAVDEELAEELAEFAELMQKAGIDSVISEMAMEAAGEEPGTIFLRLFSDKGEVLASTDSRQWGGPIQMPSKLSAAIESRDGIYFDTLALASPPYKLRSAYQTIGPGVLMQVGISLAESEAYLNIFRQLLMWILAPLTLLAVAVGWFMAHQALADVGTVASTAEAIARGDTTQRVRLSRHFLEIDRLADSFNTMVDQLHGLFRQMREMTDNIAHDLRSPLTRIRGSAEMTLIGNHPLNDFREMAVNTVEECDNLIQMINTMLDITEAEAGIASVSHEQVDLPTLVQDACMLYGTIASQKGVRLKREVPATALVISDRGKLQRIITNLLENAVKYTPGGGQVCVAVQVAEGQTCIQVRDTGIGIAADEQTKIFRRFYRCDASRSEAGMGLGLSLAMALAETLGASLTVRSILKKGSIFTLSLPMGAVTC
jgi:signal transduction histidine kinase